MAQDETRYDDAYALTDFGVDNSRLLREDTFAWWLTGSSQHERKPVSVALHLLFSNGQQAVVATKGLLGMHQPTAEWVPLLYEPGVLYGRNLLGVLQIRVGDWDTGQGSLVLSIDSTSLHPGKFGCTQLIIRDSAAETFVDWRLDNTMPYDSDDYHWSSPKGSYEVRYTFIDGPTCELGGFQQDGFKQFFQFRPITAGSIWTTVGTAVWEWRGHISPAAGPEGFIWVEKFFSHSQSISPSTELPEWRAVKFNF